VTASAQAAAPGRAGFTPVWAAVRTRIGLVALLLLLAGFGWWWTVREMQGMDGGPWTDLGTFAWFIGVWVVMMAAMMFPSVAPTVALYSRMTRSRSPSSPILFTSGYLLSWATVGALAFAIAVGGGSFAGGFLAWDRAGRWVAGATLIVAAVYELTPAKEVCLGKCRSPLGFLLGAWRDGPAGALGMGVRHGAWCIGCCWALMASLFALGVMSLVWMALVAGLIAVEKLLPWRRIALYGTTALLGVLGVMLVAVPGALPGLTIPGTGSMPGMSHMPKMETPPEKQMPVSKSTPAGSEPMSDMDKAHKTGKPEPDMGASPMGP
jgi:predicted metal-binding membrane protein